MMFNKRYFIRGLKRSLSLFLLVSIAKTDSGDIVEYNFQDRISINLINALVNSVGINSSEIIYPINVYDIQYESINQDGILDTLAGLVSIPESPLEAFPILSYQHGTEILDENAPSITGMSLNNYETTLIGLIASSSGYISIFPDYEGLGDESSFHPYIVADSYTHAVTNMIRAVRSLSFELLENQDFQYNNQLFLLGYSEGGYATLAAQRGMQLMNSDEFSVTASFPMAGPYDLAGTMVDYFLSIPTYSNPYYVPYVLTSHLWTYQGPDVEFSDYFTPFWSDTLPSLFDGTHSSSVINQMMPDNPLEILLPEILEEFENNENYFFRQSLLENTLLDWSPNSPTYLYHGMGDDIIPYANSQIAYDAFLDNGSSDVNLMLFPEAVGGHSSAAITCLLTGFEVMSNFQIINIKGDFNSDGSLTLIDLSLLLSSLSSENILSDFEWWAGDLNYDEEHTIIDILKIADQLQ